MYAVSLAHAISTAARSEISPTSAILTDLIRKPTTWRWGPQQQQVFDELKNEVAFAKCLGVPRSQEKLSW